MTLPPFTLTPEVTRPALRLQVRPITPTSWVVTPRSAEPTNRLRRLVRVRDGEWVCSKPTPCEGPCPHIAAVVLHHRRTGKVPTEGTSGAGGSIGLPASPRASTADTFAGTLGDMRVEPPPIVVPTDPRDQRWGSPPLPVTAFRPHQVTAAREVISAFDQARVVLLDGPPGSGKTLIAEMVRRLLPARHHVPLPQYSALYVCSTKTLQDQFAEDHTHAEVLKGRANYLTASGRVDSWGQRRNNQLGSHVTCADCTARGPDDDCRWCDPIVACPYRRAKAVARTAPLAVLNSSYALIDWNRSNGAFAGRHLVIVDECDLLPGELLGHVEVHIPKERVRRLHLIAPGRKTARDASHQMDWVAWVQEEALPRVRAARAALPPVSVAAPRELREHRALEELGEKLLALQVELAAGRWVYDGYERGDITFRPVLVGDWGQRLLWPHGQRWLLMSGSIVSPNMLARDLGLNEPYRVVQVPMTYPAHLRPVRAVALTEVTYKNRAQSWPKLAEGVIGVLRQHPGERVLVHTVSYPLAEYLMTHVPGRARAAGVGEREYVSYAQARERDAALAAYRLHEGSVLFAPSLDRGVDLPYGACRVQVIAKVPWPNKKDKRIAARLHSMRDGEEWYAVETVRTIMQMTGRGVRAEDDECVCYVLDHSFTANLFVRHRGLFPKWWKEALEGRYPPRRLLKRSKSSSRVTEDR